MSNTQYTHINSIGLTKSIQRAMHISRLSTQMWYMPDLRMMISWEESSLACCNAATCKELPDLTVCVRCPASTRHSQFNIRGLQQRASVVNNAYYVRAGS